MGATTRTRITTTAIPAVVLERSNTVPITAAIISRLQCRRLR
jgi:hypothetical protein